MKRARIILPGLVAGVALALSSTAAVASPSSCAPYLSSGPDDDPITCWFTGYTTENGDLGYYQCDNGTGTSYPCQY